MARAPKVISTSSVERDGRTFTVETLAPMRGQTRQQIRPTTSFRTRGPKTRVDASAKVGGSPTVAASPGVSAPRRKNGKKR